MSAPTIGGGPPDALERLSAWRKTGGDLDAELQGLLTQITTLEARLHGANGRLSAAERKKCTRQLSECYSAYQVTRERYELHILDPNIYPLLLPSDYHLMGVLAVLTGSEDPSEGWQDLGREVDGRIVPVEPWLRNPAIHTHPDDNYIVAWIRTANLQLLLSGAHFGLDLENLKYHIERRSSLHHLESWDDPAVHETEAAFLSQRVADASPNNPYYHRVILVFRFGRGWSRPNGEIWPAGQSFSSGGSPCVMMAGFYDNDPVYQDGRYTTLRINDGLSHEFGHFMSLSHPHPWLADVLNGVASLDGRNWQGWPLCMANVVKMNAALSDPQSPVKGAARVTATDVWQARQMGLVRIATWPYSLEQDCFGDPNAGIPEEYAVNDTPIDLGAGLALLHGDPAYTGSHDYTFVRCAGDDLQEVRDSDSNFIWWEVKPGTTPHTFQDSASINPVVRSNIMSYWRWEPAAQRYSADQVKRMHFWLERKRHSLVSRVINPSIHLPDVTRWMDSMLTPAIPPALPLLREHFAELTSRDAWRKPVPTSPRKACGVSDANPALMHP